MADPHRADDTVSVDRIVVYGDFNCPWSYLASRRAAALAEGGVDVEWRAVEHAPWRPSRFADSSLRFTALRAEMDHVVSHLLPGERLPYSLAGFVPYTAAAVSGYAEAHVAGVAAEVRDLLFEAFWMHSLDLGDHRVVRTLLVDAIRSGSTPSARLRRWGYAVNATGSPVTNSAWRLVGAWDEAWRRDGSNTVPVVATGAGDPRTGTAAVEWLGTQLLARGLDPGSTGGPATTPHTAAEIAG